MVQESGDTAEKRASPMIDTALAVCQNADDKRLLQNSRAVKSLKVNKDQVGSFQKGSEKRVE